jgi:very-short-patch-repair endonuclease
MERNSLLTGRSQTLRKNMTKEERLLWNCFLKKYPLQFRRQYVIGNYIADFYCHKAKLVVELDGSGHYEQKAIQRDIARTQYLESQGLQVLRFTNLEVTRQFRCVCEAIDTQAKKRFPRGEAVSAAD